MNQKKFEQFGLSARYAAPETFARTYVPASQISAEQEKLSDVYSYSVVIWELLTMKVPWEGLTVDEIEFNVRNGKTLPDPSTESPGRSLLDALMKVCRSMEPTQRPSFSTTAPRLASFAAQLGIDLTASSGAPLLGLRGNPNPEAAGRTTVLTAQDPNPSHTITLQNWWVWNSSGSTWTPNGNFSMTVARDGQTVENPEALEKFNTVASQLGFDPSSATRVYAISNKTTLKKFEEYRDLLHGRWTSNPTLWKKVDWHTLPGVEQRQQVLDWYSSYASVFNWNGEKPRVIPMLHGSRDDVVWQVCQDGFGGDSVAEDGYHGKGIYFSSTLGSAERRAIPGSGGRPILLSMVIPGHVFPVIEAPIVPDGSGASNPDGYGGRPGRSGYQSHITLLDSRDAQGAFPISGPADSSSVVGEVVAFETGQCLHFTCNPEKKKLANWKKIQFFGGIFHLKPPSSQHR